MVWRAFHWAAVAILILGIPSADAAQPKRVLLIHSFGPEFAPYSYFSNLFRTDLGQQLQGKVDFYEVSVESARFAETENEGAFVQYVLALFKDRPLDLVVTIGAPAVRFAQRYRRDLFPSTPMLVTAVDQRRLDASTLQANDAIVPVRLDFPLSIENILQVLPDTKHVALVIGDSPLEKYWVNEISRELEPFKNRLEFEWLTALSFDAILRRAARLPPRSTIFFVMYAVDVDGVPHEESRTLRDLRAVANAPMFGIFASQVGQGIVGGSLIYPQDLSRRATDIAIRMLGPDKPTGIKAPALEAGAPIYDDRELRRWNIAAARLPANNTLLFQTPRLWDQYRWQVLMTASVIAVQAMLIWVLLVERRRRTLAESDARTRLAQMARMDRTLAVGALSASLAHELNQPLGAILSNTETAELMLDADRPNLPAIKEILADVHRADQRAADIIKKLRDFLKGQEIEYREVGLSDVIDGVVQIASGEARQKGLELSYSNAPKELIVRADPVHLQQVLLNLLMNAMDAVSTRPLGERKVRLNVAQVGESEVEVSVRDTGPGIPRDELEAAFDILFTTKQQGTGLGLFIARSIIETYGGKIWAENAPDGGAVFRFLLPLSPAQPA
jgi:signal transduction histidine kinase